MKFDFEISAHRITLDLRAGYFELSLSGHIDYFLLGVTAHWWGREYRDIAIGIGPVSLCLSREHYE